MPAKDEYLEKAIDAFNRKDYETAYNIFFPVAESGSAVAQCYIASMYESGLGVELDGAMAVEWYLKAAKQEELEGKISATAYNNLGTIYSTGVPGVDVDRNLAKEYWRKAVALGFEMIPDEWLR